MMQHSYPQPVPPHQIYRTLSESHALNNNNNASNATNINHLRHHQSQLSSMALIAAGTPSLSSNGLASDDSKQATARFGRILSKKASRVKEIMLQNIGKADRSSDSVFKMHEQNFYKQHSQASKLHKAFRAHYKSLKSCQDTGRSLNMYIEEVSADYQVARHDLICDGLTNLESLTEAHLDKLRQRILLDLSQFSNNFANLRDKIAKRRRKQIDYDASKRQYELALAELNKKRNAANDDTQGEQNNTKLTIQNPNHRSSLSVADKVKSIFIKSASGSSGSFEVAEASGVSGELETTASRLVEEARLLKLREQYNYSKIMFETVNGELCDELPMLYDCKMKQILAVVHSYFSLGAKYNSECSKLMSSSGHAIEELPFAMIARQESRASSGTETHQQSEANGETNIFGRTEADENDLDDDDHDDSHEKQVMADVKAASVVASSSSGNSSRGDSASVSGQGSPDHHEDDHDIVGESVVDAGDEPGDERHQLKLDSCSNASFEDVKSESDHCADPEESNVSEESTKFADAGDETPTKLNHVADFEADSSNESLPIVNGGKILTKSQSIAAGRSMKVAQVACAPPPPPSQPINGEKTVEKTDSSSSSKFMYKVKTQFKYLAEDVDELCFEAGEIIQVIEFEPSHEPEEGWLMGMREVNGQKGLFPANFTKPI